MLRARCLDHTVRVCLVLYDSSLSSKVSFAFFGTLKFISNYTFWDPMVPRAINFKRPSIGNMIINSQNSRRKRTTLEAPRVRAVTSNSGPGLRTQLQSRNGAVPSEVVGNLLPASCVSHSHDIDRGQGEKKETQTCKITERHLRHDLSQGAMGGRRAPPARGWVKKVDTGGRVSRMNLSPRECQAHCSEADLESSSSLEGVPRKP